MSKYMLVAGTLVAFVFASPAAIANPGKGQGDGANAGIGAGIGVGAGSGIGVGAGARGNAGMSVPHGGHSDAHINAKGRVNTNGPNAAGREFGSDRASERRDLRVNSSLSARERAANELGRFNAVNSSANARVNANVNSSVGAIATYETRMRSALSISDPERRASAITSARQQLASSGNKTLTPSAVSRIDAELGINADSSLGTVR